MNKAERDFDRAHSWHPFTQMKEYLAWERLEIVRGEGCWLFDKSGNRYLDTNASVWCNVHGHAHPVLNEVLTKQAASLSHSTMLGLSNEPAAKLSAALSAVTGHTLPRVFFSDNGSNAIEIALKLSLQYWQQIGRPGKKTILHLEDAYHGDTFGTMSVGGSDAFHGRFRSWCFESPRIPHPRWDEAASLDFLKKYFAERGAQTAAVIVEPFLQGAAGMQEVSLSFLQALSALCQEHEVHLILDEVFVAFGRLGYVSPGIQHGLKPDFICWGKGISAGYLPLAATLTTHKIYEAFVGDFAEGKTFFHGHTYCGNPLACAVALCSLEMLQEAIERGAVEQTIAFFHEKMRQVFSDHRGVRQVRCCGLTAALDLSAADGTALDPAVRTGWQVALCARKHGLVVRPLLDTLLIVPPIIISEEEIDFLVQGLSRSIRETIS